MRIITGFMPATTGTVKVAGFDIFDESFEARKRIGYLPESPPLYNDMTVTAYLRLSPTSKVWLARISRTPWTARWSAVA